MPPLQCRTESWRSDPVELTIRRKTVWAAIVMAGFVVAGCSSGVSPEASSGQSPAAGAESPGSAQASGSLQDISIAYSVEAVDETQSDIAAQMKRRAADLAEEGAGNITVDIFGADDSVDRQNADIEAITSRGTDALVVTCVDPAGCVSAVDQAHDAGVKVVDVRGNLNTEKADVIYKGIDEDGIGEINVDFVRSYLEENPEAKLNFGLMMGGQTFTTTHARVQALKELATEFPDRVSIAVEGYGDWRTDAATKLFENWAVTYPDMNALACSSDEMCLGAVNTLKASGKLDDFFIVSVNGSSNGLQMLQDGDIDSTVGIDFAEYGAGMVDAAVASLKGEVPAGEVFDASEKVTVLITPENLAEYKAKAEADAEAAAPFK